MTPQTNFDQLGAIIFMQVCQKWLHAARVNGQPRFLIEVFEREFGKALDRLWEAQQRASSVTATSVTERRNDRTQREAGLLSWKARQEISCRATA